LLAKAFFLWKNYREYYNEIYDNSNDIVSDLEELKQEKNRLENELKERQCSFGRQYDEYELLKKNLCKNCIGKELYFEKSKENKGANESYAEEVLISEDEDIERVQIPKQLDIGIYVNNKYRKPSLDQLIGEEN
jgi:hypothetical protein